MMCFVTGCYFVSFCCYWCALFACGSLLGCLGYDFAFRFWGCATAV